MSVSRPISLTLAALGGQGGGVVSSWLTAVARREGYLVQATSVPGVAQRTGATIYYFEFFPEAALPADGRRPIMALMPSPGDVDIVVASELVEVGRVIQRGLVTPERTTLIASTHRTYTISEKSSLGDGRVSGQRILDAARQHSKRLVTLDMAEIATAHGTVISAVILGAIAGAAGLPFSRESYRGAIRAGGIAVERNLAAFDAAAQATEELSRQSPAATPSATKPERARPAAVAPLPISVATRIDSEVPIAVQGTATQAALRLIDYQDEAYAHEYLDTLRQFTDIDAAHAERSPQLSLAVARGLALWMSFEDTIRVAQLKTRAERGRRLRSAAQVKPDQLVHVTEFMSPRVEEICGTLPASLGRRLSASRVGTRWIGSLTGGREIRTSTISGYGMLKLIGGLRRWRRSTWRFVLERGHMNQWLRQVADLASVDYALAVELAECQALVRGYGDTHSRGLQCFEKLAAAASRLGGRPEASSTLARLRQAALADERGTALDAELAAFEQGAVAQGSR